LTRAPRDSQEIVLALMLAWVVALINALVFLVATAVHPNATIQGASLAMFVLHLPMLWLGYYGIGNAVIELWVG
jgi:hypothetical protein